MIYIASPYSHSSPEIIEERYQAVLDYTAAKINHGVVVYSPIVHCHPIAIKHGLPKEWEFWERFDREMVAAASEVWVLKLFGWEESKGVQAEIKIAQELGIPVTFIDIEY